MGEKGFLEDGRNSWVWMLRLERWGKLWLSMVPEPSGTVDQGQVHDGTESDADRPMQTLSFDGSFQLDGIPTLTVPALALPTPPTHSESF